MVDRIRPGSAYNVLVSVRKGFPFFFFIWSRIIFIYFGELNSVTFLAEMGFDCNKLLRLKKLPAPDS